MSSGVTSGLFTLGVRPDWHLPHPPLGLPVILLVRRVLLHAFKVLREQNFDLAAATEDEITEALRDVIENKLRQTGEVMGFSKRTYEFVVRQGQWRNFNGTGLTKTPDLFFKLRDDDSRRDRVVSEFDGLFIEAKPMDSTHPAGRAYCDDGLIRFVRGDYAWAMQEAMMLAYARDGRTISGHLIPAMSQADRMKLLATIDLPQACTAAGASACPAAEAIHISRHKRSFQWPDSKGAATEITVYHLWHRGVT